MIMPVSSVIGSQLPGFSSSETRISKVPSSLISIALTERPVGHISPFSS